MEKIYWLIIATLVLTVLLFLNKKKSKKKQLSIQKAKNNHIENYKSKNEYGEKKHNTTSAFTEKKEIISLTQEEVDNFVNEEIYNQTIGSETSNNRSSKTDNLFEEAYFSKIEMLLIIKPNVLHLVL